MSSPAPNVYEIDDATRRWLGERFWQDDPAVAATREEFAEVGPLIEVPNDTGALLATLLRAAGARRVLEIGTLFGCSALWMARALPADGRIDTLELEDAHADAAERLFARAGVADRVRVLRGSAHDLLATLDGPYDAAFLDADKEGYPAYLEQALRLVRPGGLIIADNMAQAGRVADPSEQGASVVAIRSFLAQIAEHPQLHANVLPVGDGVAV